MKLENMLNEHQSKAHMAWFHFPVMSRIGKFTETESRFGLLGQREQGMRNEAYRV
jgi:hypothetical protein